MERIQLLYRKSHKHDAIRYPLFIFLHIVIIYLVIEMLSNFLIVGGFLKEGFSGNGLWFVGLWIFVAFLFLLTYGIMRLGQLDKDEYLYLQGDELLYVHGKYLQRIKVKDLREIVIVANGRKILLPQRWIYFKPLDSKNRVVFGQNYEHALREWITVDELIKRVLEIYKMLKEINPNIELIRMVPRKWRKDNKLADVREVYEDGEWKTEKVIPLWMR